MLLGDQQKEDEFQVACVLHVRFPDQAYVTLKKALSQREIGRYSKGNRDEPRPPASTDSRKKRLHRCLSHNTKRGEHC